MRKHPILGRIAGYAFAIVFILAGWQLTAMAVRNPVLPGPFDAFPMVAQYFDELWPAFLVSLYRVVVAMLIGTVLAIPLGLACGRSPRADAVFAPILYFLYPLPKVVLLPVRVQGTEAPAEIAGAIRYANRYQVGDLIITGRGGGSIEDLWAFNDERVARAIYDSDIPVISAVGHEPDVTISDFVADLRAATPSNAAELAVPNAEDIRETLRGYDIRMAQAMRKQMTQRRAALENLAGRRVLQSPAAYFDLRRVELDYTRSRLTAAGERWLAARRHDFARCAAALDAMSPLKVLARGYAVATDADGAVLRSAAQTQPGDTIRVQLQDGALHCTVNNREGAHGKTETDL